MASLSGWVPFMYFPWTDDTPNNQIIWKWCLFLPHNRESGKTWRLVRRWMLWEKFFKKSINKIPTLSLAADLFRQLCGREDFWWQFTRWMKMAIEDSRWIIHKGSGFNESLPSQNIQCRFTSAPVAGVRPFIVCRLYGVRSSCVFVGNSCTTTLLCILQSVELQYNTLCILQSVQLQSQIICLMLAS